jgi:hypothetical protein
MLYYITYLIENIIRNLIKTVRLFPSWHNSYLHDQLLHCDATVSRSSAAKCVPLRCIMMMMIIMSMGRDHVSELRPPTGHQFLINPLSSLAKLPAESSSSKAVGNSEGNYEFCLTKYLFNTSKVFLTCRKILRHVADSLTLPPQEGLLWASVALKSLSPSAEFELVNLWV